MIFASKLLWYGAEFYDTKNINFIEFLSKDSLFTAYINSSIGTISIGINPEYLTNPMTLQFINIEIFNEVEVGKESIQHMSANKIIGVKSIIL